MALVFIQQQIRQVLFFLDNAVYSLMSKVYELILYLSNVNLVDNNPILDGLISRIYLILGIFMLFKVSFSVIQYIVDPNAFSDSSKGFGKLITNTLVSLVLLVAIPGIFDEAYEIQRLIISSNAIPNLVLGADLPDNTKDAEAYTEAYNQEKDEMVSMAKDIEFAIFGAFATISDDDKVGFKDKCKSTAEHPAANVIGTNDMVESGCYQLIENEMVTELGTHGGKLSDFFKYKADESVETGEACPNGICDDRNFSAYASLLWWAKSDTFVINYFPFVPTIIGGYLLFLLVSFAIDIAVRVFKLLFLQAIAPISVISYIDPKESATNSKLYKWVMETLKTFLSLFLRLAIIFLIVELVNMLTYKIFSPAVGVYSDGITASGTMNMFVYIFLILGLFAFAKQVPKMIENLFPGFKGAGDLSLNPFKAGTVSGSFLGGTLGGVLGSASGAGSNLLSSAKDLRQAAVKGYKKEGLDGVKDAFKKKGFGVIKNPIAGAVSGGFVGARSGIKNGVSGGMRQGRSAAIRGKQLKESGYGVAARMEQSYNQAIGYRGTAAETGIGNDIKQARQEQQNWNAQEEQIRSAIATHAANYEGGKFASQIQMITRTQQVRDKNGELSENMLFKNYADYKDKQIAAKVMNKDVSELTTDDITKARRDHAQEWNSASSSMQNRFVTEEEFENISSLINQQIYASTKANELESTIKRLEAGKKSFNEKPK